MGRGGFTNYGNGNHKATNPFSIGEIDFKECSISIDGTQRWIGAIRQ